MSWDKRVPFIDGVMVEYDGEWRLPDSRVSGPRVLTGWNGGKDTTIDVQFVPGCAPFAETLVYEDLRHGRSAVRMYFRGAETGRRYSMPLEGIRKIMPLIANGIVFGRWMFTKQGANYGIVPADDVKS